MFYIHKNEIAQQYGGPEEGGWWYESGQPVEGWIPRPFEDEETAYAECRILNADEYERQEREEDYSYSSVLSHLSHHYSYTVTESSIPKAYPNERPHYE